MKLILLLAACLLAGCSSMSQMAKRSDLKPTIVQESIEVSIRCVELTAYILIEATGPGTFGFHMDPRECGEVI